MNYKELFKRLYSLLVSPKKTWVEISTETPRRDVLGGFVYPLIAICGLVVLLSAFIEKGLERSVYQPALMSMCSTCIALFCGFFLATWLFDMLRQRMLGHSSDMATSQLFVGYAMGATILADILVVIFPQYFLFWWILRVYVLYVVWEGCEVCFTIADNQRMSFAGLTSVIVVMSPMIIRWVFDTLSNLLG
jgi:hypothetical protein